MFDFSKINNSADYSNINVKAALANCNHSNYEAILELCINKTCPITVNDLAEHGYKEIERLRNDVNAYEEELHWKDAQHDFDRLIDFINKCESGKYTHTHYQEAITIRNNIATSREEAEWQAVRTSQNIATLRDFITKCERGVFSKKHIEDAKNQIEIVDWRLVQNSSDISALSEFISKCRSGEYSRLFLPEAEARMEQIAQAGIEKEWEEIKAITNEDEQRQQINMFVIKYAQNISTTTQKCISEANTLMAKIEDRRQARIDWIDATHQKDILPYIRFVENHPLSDMVPDAQRIIAEMKNDILTDMKRSPFKYFRPKMYDLLQSGVFSKKELVDNSGILTEAAYNHILQYPQLVDEQRMLPLSTLENPRSHPNNTDIIFFGIKNSGKTCVLSGLMYMQGRKNPFKSALGNDYVFKFDPRGEGGGGNYAMELQRYANVSMLPPATDKGFVQVIDTTITDQDGKVHPTAFIEMSGEKTVAFAAMDRVTDLEDLGPGAASILSNGNNKIIFFVIDPVNTRDIMIDSKNMVIQQSNVMNCITALLSRYPDLMKKVQAMHIIVTKSDTLGDYVDPNVLQQMLSQQGYDVVIDEIKGLCRKYPHINTLTGHEVGIFTFHVGKFMPGEVYTFDPTDACKIINVIGDNTLSIRPRSFRDTISDLFNR